VTKYLQDAAQAGVSYWLMISRLASLSYCCDIADHPDRDERIGALIRNGLQEKKRSFFVVVGDQAKDVIVRLHYIMSMVDIKQNKSVLWAYKKKLLGFTR
jgi:hypothetical protein